MKTSIIIIVRLGIDRYVFSKLEQHFAAKGTYRLRFKRNMHGNSKDCIQIGVSHINLKLIHKNNVVFVRYYASRSSPIATEYRENNTQYPNIENNKSEQKINIRSSYPHAISLNTRYI